jgi:hypothetical protein
VADPRGVLKTQGRRAPGNREEEKTLTTRKMAIHQAWATRERHWVVGSRGREAMVTPLASRYRVEMGRDQKTYRGIRV